MLLKKGHSLLLWSFVSLLEAEASPLPSTSNTITISQSPSNIAGIPLDSFVSFSIELSSFPDFAGNISQPNSFSYNLLRNLGKLQGSNPEVRVGGNTQDIAIFDESQKTGIIGVIHPEVSTDYPTEITIGPSFFESYNTWPGIKFSHGFNMGANSSSARAATWASAPYACKALRNKLAYWEYGNEPDLFHASGYRPADWDEEDYVSEWLNGTREIRAAVRSACPDLVDTKFLAPSFAGTQANDFFTLDPVKAWAAGLDKDKDIGLISSHNYMGVSTSPGITLQGTLMNHSNVIAKAEAQLNESRAIAALPDNLDPKVPFILGEHNSLARQGRPGLSNSFGAALWGVDWNLYLASRNISRSHMHQGTNYRYQSWQPIQTNLSTKGTKAPYYGNIAVAAFLHKPKRAKLLQISHLPLNSEVDAAYAAHVDGKLVRALVVNLRTYNTSSWNANYTSNYPRPTNEYTFQLPKSCRGVGRVQRLIANGSDALSGITFDGYSYNYELDDGKAVRLGNVTRSEVVRVKRDGSVELSVPWSSAAIVNFNC